MASAGTSAEGTGAVRKALLPVGSPDEARRLLRSRSRWPAAGPLTPPPRRARWKALLSYHFLAAGHDDTLAVAVTGRVRRETTWVPLAKAQSVRLVQGPLQRRLGLATVHLDAAGRRVRAEFRERAAGAGQGRWSTSWPRSAVMPARWPRWQRPRCCPRPRDPSICPGTPVRRPASRRR